MTHRHNLGRSEKYHALPRTLYALLFDDGGMLRWPKLEPAAAGEAAPLPQRRLAPSLPVPCAGGGDSHPGGNRGV